MRFLTELAATVSFSTRGSVVLANVIVLVVTWTKAMGTVREASHLNPKAPLSKTLIRDGTLFFIIPPIIISRFTLNLRQENHTSEDLRSSQESAAPRKSIIRFLADILIGKMGESLRFQTEYNDPGAGSGDERNGSELGGLDVHPPEGSNHDTEGIAQDAFVA
ncbi:hypothetical protein BC835DRAFT_558114 [Cytidiella melzeri]|nr:hypothetical protein BC835DRAFT_558114 [Cytidiella melzeri]